LGLKTAAVAGCVTVPCIGNVVIPAAVGDRTVGVAAAAAAAAAAAWNVPSNGARDRQQSRANYLAD